MQLLIKCGKLFSTVESVDKCDKLSTYSHFYPLFNSQNNIYLSLFLYLSTFMHLGVNMTFPLWITYLSYNWHYFNKCLEINEQ